MLLHFTQMSNLNHVLLVYIHILYLYTKILHIKYIHITALCFNSNDIHLTTGGIHLTLQML